MLNQTVKTKVVLVNKNPTNREVLCRALKAKLQAAVTDYSCVEDLLLSTLDYDVFILYSDLGSNMSGARGTREVKTRKPQAFVVGVSNRPDKQTAFLTEGANVFLLRSGNEIEELVAIVKRFEKSRISA